MKVLHYRGCGSQRKDMRFCPCGDVDHTIRLSPEAQVDAIFMAEDLAYQSSDYDPGADWYVYLRDCGWDDARIYGRV